MAGIEPDMTGGPDWRVFIAVFVAVVVVVAVTLVWRAL